MKTNSPPPTHPTNAELFQRGIQPSPTFYLSGPMVGHPADNHPLFRRVARRLREGGRTVVDPSANPQGLPREEYMRLDLPACIAAGNIALLPGWQKSEGALLELLVTLATGGRVYEVELTRDHAYLVTAGRFRFPEDRRQNLPEVAVAYAIAATARITLENHNRKQTYGTNTPNNP